MVKNRKSFFILLLYMFLFAKFFLLSCFFKQMNLELTLGLHCILS